MRYKITKYVEAKSIKHALKLEKETDVHEIGKDTPETETHETFNTHAIGFHTGQEYSDEGI
jgi:hypothetical protein